MSKNVIFVGWNRPSVGREKEAGKNFNEFMAYVIQLQQEGAIDSFEPLLLNPHGGDLNGFVLIRGEVEQLQAVKSTDTWQMFVTRAGLSTDGFGVVDGVTGEGVMEWMERWTGMLSE